MTTIGFIEGIAEATASITKIFSGALSDYFRKRKLLVVIGYGLGAISKPFFPLATGITWVFAARFVDRLGKGIRGAPRDALIADISPPHLRGAAYGIRQTLDSVGACVGPMLAVLLLVIFTDDLKAALWVAVLPAFIALALLITLVREPSESIPYPINRALMTLKNAEGLGQRYWIIVALGAIFTLARFSEAFLVLRVQHAGLTLPFVPIVMIVMNVVYAASAYPAGMASDHVHWRVLLLWGLGVLILSDVVFAYASSINMVLFGAALWGLHMALTQGLFSKLVADSAPASLRGTAFGLFHLVAGMALLLASVIAGMVWDLFGPEATFMIGAGFASLATIGLLAYWSRL